MTPAQKSKMADRAIADEKLSDGAARLILLLLAVESDLPTPFALSHKQAGWICGITDKATLYARIKQLCPAYLNRVELNGCPPTWKYKFNSKL